MILNKLRKITVFIAAVLLGLSAQAQSGIDSPYSRFGLGTLTTVNQNARQQGMGGLGYAIGSNRFVNPLNPASYGSIDSLSFLFNAGLYATSVTYRTTTQTQTGNHAQLSYFAAGFPVTNWWKSGISLMPYSRTGFNVIVPGQTTQGVRYNKKFEGTGGINRFIIGNAFSPVKNLSVGVNANFMFGRNTNASLLYFPDSNYMATTLVERRLLISDFTFDAGLLYNVKLKDNYSLQLGLTHSFGSKLNVQREYLIQSQFGGINGGITYVLDTILYEARRKENIELPWASGAGIAIEKQNRWMAGLDFNWQNWENNQSFGNNDSLINSWNIAVGGHYIPVHTAISGYWRKVTYRAGARYHQTYLQLNGQPINEFGISFGASLPLPRTFTTVDVSMEIGRRGTTASNLIRETFVNFTAGVSIYERWFVKRKYN
jgi:hypothetical protein